MEAAIFEANSLHYHHIKVGEGRKGRKGGREEGEGREYATGAAIFAANSLHHHIKVRVWVRRGRVGDRQSSAKGGDIHHCQLRYGLSRSKGVSLSNLENRSNMKRVLILICITLS